MFVFLFSMVEELQQPYFVESVGGVHEDVASIAFIQMLKNVHLEFNIALLDVDVSQFVAIKHKLWLGNLTHACLYVGEFFVVNNGLHVDLVNTQML